VADLTGAVWRKSSRSNGTNNCVEVATNLAGIVAIRDSKDPEGSALVVDPASFAAFAEAVKSAKL
jgi:hypothetical protein